MSGQGSGWGLSDGTVFFDFETRLINDQLDKFIMQNNIEQERERKYNLLKEGIIEAGYDPMAFQVYCETIKQNGSEDIDVWTIDELTQTINNFKRMEEYLPATIYNKAAALQAPPEPIRQSEKLQQSDLSQARAVDIQIIKNLDDTHYNNEIECHLPERTALTDYILENSHKQVEIVMTEYMLKSEGLFNTGYGAFKVETKPIGWVVWRRFTDFQKLREALQKSYPQNLIPPIPSKKLKSKTSNDHLEKRMRVMELFLQNCLYHPLFKTHPALSDFLSITDDNKLKERAQVYEKAKGPCRPADYVMVNGACVLEISPELTTYSNTLQDYLKNSGEIYKRLGTNFKKLIANLGELTGTLGLITENFNSLDKITEYFVKTNQSKTKGEIQQIQIVYQELSKYMTGWSQGIGFQTKNVKENFYEFFRYHKKMQQQTFEYLQTKQQLQAKFKDAKDRLNEKKEKLYVQGDPSKWDLPADLPKTVQEIKINKAEAFKFMLPNETRLVSDLRDNLAFMNRQLVDEVNQMMDFRIKVYAKKFVRMGQMKALETAKFHHVLANFLQVLAEMQGSTSGQMCNRKASVFIDNRYDNFFGMKPK